MVIIFFAGNLLGKFRSSESPHLLGVESAKIDRLTDIGVGFGPRFGDFENFDRRKLVAATLQNVGRPIEQTRPLFNRRPSPRLECRARSFNSALSFGNSCLGSVTDNLARLGWTN